MNELQMKCFLMAGECLNFTEASQRIYVSQATLSRNIASLEAELGFLVFERSGNTVRMTPAGRVMFEAIKKANTFISDATHRAQDINAGIVGYLRIGILDGQMLDSIIHSSIKSFEKKYPNVKLDLSSGSYADLTDKLYGEQLDLAVTLSFDVNSKPGLKHEMIEELDTYIVIPQNHKLAGRSVVSLGELKDDCFITSINSSQSAYESYVNMIGIYGVAPKIIIAPDIKTQMLWLEAGRGVSRANRYHMMCNSPVLTEVRAPEFPNEHLVIAWQESNINPAANNFIDILVSARDSIQ